METNYVANSIVSLKLSNIDKFTISHFSYKEIDL